MLPKQIFVPVLEARKQKGSLKEHLTRHFLTLSLTLIGEHLNRPPAFDDQMTNCPFNCFESLQDKTQIECLNKK